MLNLPVLSWIGNAAAALFGKHGAVTAQAEQAGCSRQTVYNHAIKVQEAVADAHLSGPSRADLLEENRRLQQDNQHLREQLAAAQQQAADTIPFGPSQRLCLAVVAWAMGLSLNQIADLFRILLGGTAKVPDRATIGRWVLGWARRAGKVLAVLDEHTAALARYLCPDETFFRQQTVLMAVEPFSMAWLLGQRAKDRKGTTWHKALVPFDHLEFVQSDQGTGLQKGLRLLAEQRQQAAAKAEGNATPKPVLSNGLDLFHIAQEARVPLRAAWRQVAKAFTAYEAARAKLVKAQQKKPQSVGSQTRSVNSAWQRVELYWSLHEQREKAWQRARAAFELFRPDGTLNDRVWAQQEIKAACAKLPGPAWQKVRKLLNDVRTLAFLDRTNQEVVKAEPRAEVREALLRLWRLEHRPRPHECPAAPVVARVVCARLGGADWATSYARVARALTEALRSSSAVECVNSIVRMQQARHRNLSQAMLDLKRLYWNCRSFREGPRADQCPYQLLGASLPTFDFWELLQMPPDVLRQKLSSQRVAA
jgi:hypothetical protein